MISAKWMNRIFVCALAGCVLLGCSNSSAPAPSYSLNLTLVSHTGNIIFDTLQFQVTKDGKNLAGASLISITDPYYIQNTLGISDSAGKFSPVSIINNDSFAQIAYKAIYDTFTSNNVFWQWQ